MLLSELPNKVMCSNTAVAIVKVEDNIYATAGINFSGGGCDCCLYFYPNKAEVLKIFDAVTGGVFYDKEANLED